MENVCDVVGMDPHIFVAYCYRKEELEILCYLN